VGEREWGHGKEGDEHEKGDALGGGVSERRERGMR